MSNISALHLIKDQLEAPTLNKNGKFLTPSSSDLKIIILNHKTHYIIYFETNTIVWVLNLGLRKDKHMILKIGI